MKNLISSLLCIGVMGCARTDIYYPSNGKDVVIDERGHVSRHHNRAVVLNGSDSLGNTVIDVTNNGVRFASAGGIDNSTSTKEGYRTVRHGVGTAALTALGAVALGEASAAYGANQAQVATSNSAASSAAASQTATRGATAVQLSRIHEGAALKAAEAAKALPAAGSTINSVVPSVVTPIVP